MNHCFINNRSTVDTLKVLQEIIRSMLEHLSDNVQAAALMGDVTGNIEAHNVDDDTLNARSAVTSLQKAKMERCH